MTGLSVGIIVAWYEVPLKRLCLDPSYTTPGVVYARILSNNHILSSRSPAIEPVVDDGPEELKPPS